MGKKKTVGDLAADAVATTPLPPPEDRLEVNVLPGIIVNVYIHPDDLDDDSPAVTWPQVVACPPMVDDLIVANDQATTGRVLLRSFSLDPVVGPILNLAVRIVEVVS